MALNLFDRLQKISQNFFKTSFFFRYYWRRVSNHIEKEILTNCKDFSTTTPMKSSADLFIPFQMSYLKSNSFKILQELDTKKSPGLNGTPRIVLNNWNCAPEVTQDFKIQIYNSGIIPDGWKEIEYKPFQKKNPNLFPIIIALSQYTL